MNLVRVGDTDWPLTTPVAPSLAIAPASDGVPIRSCAMRADT
jgi:hypothetical protein